jgi:hypothetical protein
MEINIYAFAAAALTLTSLFLPWLSFAATVFPGPGILGLMSWAYTPFQVSGSWVVWNTSSFSAVSIVQQEVFRESVRPILYRQPFWSTENVHLVAIFTTSMLYLSTIVLLIHASFAAGSWSGTGRKIALGSSNLSFLSIFLYVMLNCWYLDEGKGGGWATMVKQNGVIAVYLNVGFWLAILGSVAAYVSWLHPKFIRIETKIWTGKIEAFKRSLPVSEWQKIAVIATSSFLVIFVFAIIYLFLTPQTF